MTDDIPKLRSDLNLIPVIHQGRQALVVQDRSGLISSPVLIQDVALDILSLINGRNSVDDIRLTLIRMRGGELLTRISVGDIIAAFNEASILDTPETRRKQQKLKQAFRKQKCRQSVFSGKSYPEEESSLRKYLDRLVRSSETASGRSNGRIRGLIAPHIDLEIGGDVTGRAYAAVSRLKPELVVILGTGHDLTDTFFSVSEKSFKTPLGITETDKDWIRDLIQAGGAAVSPDDWAHRSEHSIEFSLIFTQHLFGCAPKIVPVLCGSFLPFLKTAGRPSAIPEIRNFLCCLEQGISRKDSDVLVIASVDFSHVGPKFGHRFPAEDLKPQAEVHDAALIAALENGDVESFWKESSRTGDATNVCGFSSMACLLEILPGVKGQLLGYQFWMEEATRSAVSYAALIMF